MSRKSEDEQSKGSHDSELAQSRREALKAAERSGIREGLPPASDFARAIGERWADNELTADQAAEAIVKYHRDRASLNSPKD